MATGLAPDAERELARLAEDYENEWAPQCFRIADKQLRLRPLVLNPVQRAIGAAEREERERHGNARIYILKGRRAGVTTDQQARSLHCCWSTPFANTLTLAHTRDATDKIFEQITKRAVDHFPPELLPTLGDRGAKEVHFAALDSRFYTATAGSGNAARGGGLVRAHLSEYAFYDQPATVRKAVTPSMIPLGSTVVLETTASAFESEPHQFYREAKRGENGYRALFFPWWECDPINDRLPLMAPDEMGELTDAEQQLVALHAVSLEQIKWRRHMVREMGGIADFLQEYPEDDESCWLTAGDLFFDTTMLRALKLSAPQPIRVTPDGVRIYAEYQGDEPISLGADTAEGGGGDRSTFAARGCKTGRLYADYESSAIEPEPFATLLDKTGRGYGFALLVVEKNMHGITVLRKLRDVHQYPIGSIYHRRSHDKTQKHEEEQQRIGWVTTGESQPLLLDAGRELFGAVVDGYASCPSGPTITDAFGVRRDDKGKISLTGKDVLVAEMLSWIGRSTPSTTPRVRKLS
jgi:hypothetical protein